MKLQILVPQYEESFDIIKPLLDSIEIQQSIDMNDIGVIIVSDGGKEILDTKRFDQYSYPIEYHLSPHLGVSGARNTALDLATADYVMFCDADDMFFNACGLYIVFREIETGGFDMLISTFVEETRDSENNPVYLNHTNDGIFVHGKFFKRQYLIDKNIRWNPALTIHEDSFFNCLAARCTKDIKYSTTPFYLWKWRDNSVCRHDPKYMLKTYNNFLDSNEALVQEFISRGMMEAAQYYTTWMVYHSYYTMNKKDWIDQKNKDYRIAVEKRFKEYYYKFFDYFDQTPEIIKNSIIMQLKNRKYSEGLFLEEITFKDWIKFVLENY